MNAPDETGTALTAVRGDITEQQVDAIVNAANSSLLGGGGVDGAIHRKGGPEILAACRRLRAGHYGRGLPPGRAVVTTAGRLPARCVVHTVGPVWTPGRAEEAAEVLASCHTQALRAAAELGARTVAFPAISTGIFGYPVDAAAPVAVAAVRAAVHEAAGRGHVFEEVRFVLFSEESYDIYAAEVAR
ncbi:O-acetyl-ADP-ribose deacetylase [Mangrovactinospora gilvigrisea]|uniref:O-acetyl-ADP-ribose deacetylase n=1 Tax=Mangrovactinospora gilvigrisea TaxID=1428644 RepID=A0A1J7C8C9_9ACTN|nr:O-acetyl-ADP-ribose deacetylase [Mangrovactinospora gilvigrisea]OIV37784.1 O-acetyl-ADP-ribose deacetylase [Mangrovactinospora gilvigrisea]